jgi:hypothetical protein
MPPEQITYVRLKAEGMTAFVEKRPPAWTNR